MFKIVVLVMAVIVATANAGLLDFLFGTSSRTTTTACTRTTPDPETTPAPENTCNCIEIEYSEMPASALTCISPDFLIGLAEKITTNFNLMYQELEKINSDCNLTDVEIYIEERRIVTLNIINVLSGLSPNIETLNAALVIYEDVKKAYNAVFRDAIANGSTECSNVLIRLRSVPSTTAENIIAAVLKCLEL